MKTDLILRQEPRSTNDLRGTVTLVPPWSKDFSVYGDAGVNERARQWALDDRYFLVEGVSRCAHGLYGLYMCPGNCYGDFHLDHVNVWAPADVTERPFVLFHPYWDETDVADSGVETYAKAHGLNLRRTPLRDGWYGHDSMALRLQPTEGNWPLLGLEADVTLLLSVSPVEWPPRGADLDLLESTTNTKGE